MVARRLVCSQFPARKIVILKNSGKSGRLLESFQKVWKASRKFSKFLTDLKFIGNLEKFRTALEIYGFYGRIPESLEGFQTV